MFVSAWGPNTQSSANGNANIDTIASEKKNAESQLRPLSGWKNVQLTSEYVSPLNAINVTNPRNMSITNP